MSRQPNQSEPIIVDQDYQKCYHTQVMKAAIHPELKKTKVTCLGCNTTFETMSTVEEMSVELCSKCHPFYTGKQKLIDTAGRVDRFRAKQEKAQPGMAAKKTKPSDEKPTGAVDAKAKLAEIKEEIIEHTVDAPTDTDQAPSKSDQ